MFAAIEITVSNSNIFIPEIPEIIGNGLKLSNGASDVMVEYEGGVLYINLDLNGDDGWDCMSPAILDREALYNWLMSIRDILKDMVY